MIPESWPTCGGLAAGPLVPPNLFTFKLDASHSHPTPLVLPQSPIIVGNICTHFHTINLSNRAAAHEWRAFPAGDNRNG